MPSAYYHVANLKRSFALSPHMIIIVAIMGGVIMLNVILLFAWCTLQRRRMRERREQEIATDFDYTFAQKISLAVPDSPRRASPGIPTRQDPTNMEITHSLQNTDTPRPNVPSSPNYPPVPSSRPTSWRKPSQVYEPDMWEEEGMVGLSRRASAQRTNLYPLEMHRGGSIRRGASLRRSNSMDTASIYSSASAPIDAHERLFQPLALEPVPSSAPAWATDSNNLQSQQRLSLTSMTIREELAPETYLDTHRQWKPRAQHKPRLQWKAQPAHDHLRTASASSDSEVPPVPQVPRHIRALPVLPPPAALRLNPSLPPSEHSRSLSASSGSTDSPVVPPGLWPTIASTTPPLPLNIIRSKRFKGKSSNALPPALILITPPPPTDSPPIPPPELPPRSPSRPTRRGYDYEIGEAIR